MPTVRDEVKRVLVTLYTTEWCGHCRRLKRQLDEIGIPVVEIDVDANPEYGQRIVAATGGYRIVPTVELAGELLVNPSAAEIARRLAGGGPDGD